MERPTRSYIAALIVVAVQVIWWLLTTMLTTNTDFVDFVNGLWPSIWLLTAGFVAGLVAEDLNNPRSWLRNNWRRWGRRFDVVRLDSNYCQDPERVDILCSLRFLRRVQNEKLLVRVTLAIPTRGQFTYIVRNEMITEAEPDSGKTFRVGSLSVTKAGDPFARHSLWGEQIGGKDLPPGQFPIGPSSRYLVEISMGRQTYRALVHTLPRDRKDFQHVYVITEDYYPSLA